LGKTIFFLKPSRQFSIDHFEATSIHWDYFYKETLAEINGSVGVFYTKLSLNTHIRSRRNTKAQLCRYVTGKDFER